MKKLFILAVVVAIAATLVNDVGRYITGLGKLDSGTREIANAASSGARKDRNRLQPGGKAAVKAAQEQGLQLYGYEVQGRDIEIWTSIAVDGTWVAGPFLAWRAGKPLDTPLTITNQYSTMID